MKKIKQGQEGDRQTDREGGKERERERERERSEEKKRRGFSRSSKPNTETEVNIAVLEMRSTSRKSLRIPNLNKHTNNLNKLEVRCHHYTTTASYR